MHKVAVAVGAVLFSHSLAFAQTPAPTAADFAAAMDVPAADLLSAGFDAASNSLSRRVTDAYGTALVPRQGVTLVTLSTGRALDASDPGFVSPEPGTNWNIVSPNPYIDAGVFVTANGNVCGDVGDSPPTVNDLTELRLTLRVPPGATALAFDFNFITAEYPEWLCNPTLLDRFVALLEAGGQTTNIAVDSAGRSISSNSIQYLVGTAPSPETGFPPLLGAAELSAPVWTRFPPMRAAPHGSRPRRL